MYLFELTYKEIATAAQTILTIRAGRLDIAKTETSIML